jgi:hypothetical protein
MNDEFTALPDCDAIRGASLIGNIWTLAYQRADGATFELSMTLVNAQALLAMLADLPDADRIFRKAREFRATHPI